MNGHNYRLILDLCYEAEGDDRERIACLSEAVNRLARRGLLSPDKDRSDTTISISARRVKSDVTTSVIGNVDVDSGLLMVGDPCRFFPAGGTYCDGRSENTRTYKDWSAVLKFMNEKKNPKVEPAESKTLPGAAGSGMAHVIRTGGDGQFDVRGIYKDNRLVGFMMLTEDLPKETIIKV